MLPEICPENNTDYHVEHDNFPFDKANKTDTWEDCAAECSKELLCTHWTWIKQDHVNESFRKRCLFKPKRDGVQSVHTSISGSRNCTEETGDPNTFI